MLRKLGIAISALGLAAGALALDTPAQPQGLQVGVLTCNVASGFGFIFGSSRAVNCTFSPTGGGPPQRYVGAINKFGVDIGYLQGGVIVWTVVAPTANLGPGALSGTYEGVTQSDLFCVAGRLARRSTQRCTGLGVFVSPIGLGPPMNVITNVPGNAVTSGCGHAIAGIAIAAAAALRRRRVLAQHRLSANACRTQTARTFSRPCTRKRDMPRFLMMPCARSVSLRRR